MNRACVKTIINDEDNEDDGNDDMSLGIVQLKGSWELEEPKARGIISSHEH